MVKTPPVSEARQRHSPSACALGTTKAQVASSETTSRAPRALTQAPIGGGPASAGATPHSSIATPAATARTPIIVPSTRSDMPKKPVFSEH